MRRALRQADGGRAQTSLSWLADTLLSQDRAAPIKVLPSHGPWRGLDALEYATLSWVDWYNHHRLFSTIGYVPPAEYEAALDRETVPARAGTQ